MNLNKILYFTAMLGVSFSVFAQEINLNIKEAVERAYNHDYNLKNTKLDVENRELEVKKAYKEMLPSVDYRLESTKFEKDESKNSKDVDRYSENSITLSQPLFEGGALLAQLDSAKQSRKRERFNYKDSKINTKLSAIDKYLRVIISTEELKVYEISLGSLQKQYEKINRKYELDMIPKTEVLPVNTRVLNLKTKVVESKNGIAVSTTDLKNYIGIKNRDSINLENIEENEYDVQKIDVETDIKYARKSNRRVKMVDVDTKIKENDKVIARSEFLPKVSAFYTQKSGDEEFSKSDDDFNWEAGVAVNMNIFEFGKSIDEYKIKEKELKKAENLKDKMKDDIELEIRKNYLNLLKYKGIVEEQKAAVLSARENYNLESRRFEMDLIDAVSFVQIEETLVDAELSLLVAKYNYFMAYEQYKSLLE